jgi:hypothetical protein
MFDYVLIINATTETFGGLGSSRSDLILRQLIDSNSLLKSDAPPAIMLYPVVGIWSCWVWQKIIVIGPPHIGGKVFLVCQDH